MSTGDPGSLPAATLAAALLDQSAESHALSDRAGVLLWANLAFHQRYGTLLPPGSRLQTVFRVDTETGDVASDVETVDQVLDWRGAHPPATERASAWLHLRISTLGEYRLWTVRDISAERALGARLQRLEELLDIAQEFGRLGVWERELASGKGRWDDHVFRFWGIGPNQTTPSFEDAACRIHPDDRNSRAFAESSQAPGRYSQRFRVIQPDGSLRWLHSHWEIKTAEDGLPSHAVGIMVDDSDTVAMARQLSEATAKLSIAVQLGEIIIFEQNLASGQMTLNPRGCEVLGLPFSEHGVPIAEFEQLCHPDDREEMQSAGIRAAADRRPVDMQVRFRRPDGEWRHLLSRRVLQRDARDRPLAFVGVALDVTERMQAQRALEETARGLEVATSAAGVGIWSRDIGTGEGQWNGQMFRLFDREPDLGPPSRDAWLSDMVHPDDRPLMSSVQGRLTVSPDGAGSEYRVRRPDGSVRWLFELARREERNGRLMIFGATMDVTARKQADLALRQANERIALATRGAGIGSWEHDLATGEVCWDEQMFLLRGLSMPSQVQLPSRAAGELRRTLIHPDDIDQVDADHRRSLGDASMASHEYRVRWPDGSFRWLASRAIAVRDEGGHAVRQIGVEWDVHERVMADEVRREAQAAQQQSEAKAALLARMSHELRTPLNAILGFTDLLARESTAHVDTTSAIRGAGIERSERLAHIRHAAERLLELVDDVLDLSGIETGELSLQPDAVALLPLLQEIIGSHEQKARVRSVRLKLQGDPVAVLADQRRLRQILSKLVAHHVASAPSHGELALSVTRAGDDVCIAIAEHSDSAGTALQLELFGDAEGPASATEVEPGADFGLFGALLNGMNGRIERQRCKAAGTELVLLWLPVAQNDGHVTTVAAPLQTPVAAHRPARVLYIEDNPVNVILVEELIRQRGDIDFCSEPHGHAGISRALLFEPDLILIDIHLPDIDGFEVLRQLRAEPKTSATCCVALSANAMPEDVARARAAGFDDYWTKPIRFASFLAGLERLLPARAPQPSA